MSSRRTYGDQIPNKAPDTGGLRGVAQAVGGEEADAVLAPPTEVQQREGVAHVTHVGVAGAHQLVDGIADRHVGVHPRRHPGVPFSRTCHRWLLWTAASTPAVSGSCHRLCPIVVTW